MKRLNRAKFTRVYTRGYQPADSIKRGEIRLLRRLLQNTRKPQGLLGRVMLFGMNKGHKPLADWGLSHLHLEADAHVLDVGCGGGANIAALLKHCPKGQVDGLDYSPESVAASKKKNSAALGRRCTVLQGDVGAIPYAESSYDTVTAFETVYFWPDLPQAFSEILRVLKPGGRFLLVCEMGDPTDTTWTSRIDGMTVYSGEELNVYLKNAGFTNITLSHKSAWLCLLAEKPALENAGFFRNGRNPKDHDGRQ